jgi:hypothetical protein
MTHDPVDPTSEDAPAPGASPRPTDADVRAIAEQLVREVRRPPAASPGAQLSASRHELAPADEERVDDALVALGAADPEDTLRAEREAAGEQAPPPAPGDARDGGRGGTDGR